MCRARARDAGYTGSTGRREGGGEERVILRRQAPGGVIVEVALSERVLIQYVAIAVIAEIIDVIGMRLDHIGIQE